MCVCVCVCVLWVCAPSNPPPPSYTHTNFQPTHFRFRSGAEVSYQLSCSDSVSSTLVSHESCRCSQKHARIIWLVLYQWLK